MKHTVIIALLMLTIVSRNAQADSDGYYCSGPGYIAWQFGMFPLPGTRHYLFIVRYGNGSISAPDSVVIPQFFQVHGMRCRAEGVDLAEWYATHTVTFAAPGTRPTVASVPLAVAGQMPAWARGVANLAAYSRAWSTLETERHSLLMEPGVREYVLEISAARDSVRDCPPTVTARVVEVDASQREMRTRLLYKGSEAPNCVRRSLAPVEGASTTGTNPLDVLLNVVVFGVRYQISVAPYSGQLRTELEDYLRRADSYRTPRPPVSGRMMGMVDAAWLNHERQLFGLLHDAAISRDSAVALAVGYVEALKPCYEWEGFHDCPEREAKFADAYLAAHPNGPLTPYLPLLAAHRWICASLGFSNEGRPADVIRSREEYLARIAVARRSSSLLARTAADRLAQLGVC